MLRVRFSEVGGAVASVPVLRHLPSFMLTTAVHFTRCYELFFCASAFSSNEFLQFVQKDTSPLLKCPEPVCFYHLHSRIDFFSIFIRNGIEKKKNRHSETFYNIFIRSCGPKVQRFGWRRSSKKRRTVFLKRML